MRTTLKENETVALVIKLHWFVLVLPSLIFLTGIVLAILIGNYGYILPLVTLCYLVYKIIERENNLWAVTSLRVIDEFGVFSLNSKESPLDKINNVTYEQSIWGRIFGFGNVQIQTAAEIGSTQYFKVEKPKLLKDTITQMQEEYKNAQFHEMAKAFATANQKQFQPDVAAEIEKLFELKLKGILTDDEFISRKKKLLNT